LNSRPDPLGLAPPPSVEPDVAFWTGETTVVHVKVFHGSVLVPGVVGLALALAGLSAMVEWVDWLEVGRWLRPRAGVIGVFGFAAMFLIVATARAVRRPPRQKPTPALSWWVVAGAAAVVAGVAWGATSWLLREAEKADDPAAARVEAIKTGLTIGAGTGGVFALLLAVRRQWHQELSSSATELDASEKRVTELYTKAADQLGSAQAPVRLAGLYALERVAQGNPDQRETIVNVLCAYLRMPYLPPEGPPDDADEQLSAAHREQIQEREVRLTAQRLLSKHLEPEDSKDPGPLYWGEVNIDLTGAALIDFSLADCKAGIAIFKSATFTGHTDFEAATFKAADFESATFNGDADFDSCRIFVAYFESAKFIKEARFNSAHFGHLDFKSAKFNRSPSFQSATLSLGQVPPQILRYWPE
jgi:Pentapeptide repeats (9 copies)